jgi:tRNA(fMet)-specific endonuclease VapC
MARVILDTGILIEAARRRLDLSSLVRSDDVVVPAIAFTEYLVGVELDPDEARRARQRSFLKIFLDTIPVADYGTNVMPHHVELILHTRRQGRPRGTFDLIIAATARATDRVLLTTDGKAGFEELPGVHARVIS